MKSLARRSALKALGATLAAGIMASAAVTVTQAQDQVFLNMGATPASSGFFAYFVAAGQSIEKGTDGRVVVNVMETGSSVDNLRRMRRGEMEMGLSTSDVAGQAARGIGVFEGEEPWTDLRRLYLFAVVPNIYTVRADANVSDVMDLTGKPFNAGITGSSTEAQTMAVFDVLGIEADLYSATTGDAITAIQDGQIIGYSKSAASATSADSSFLQLATSTDVRVLGLSEEQIAKVREAHPYYASLRVPAGVYPNQEEDIRTMGTAPGLVATVDSLSEEDAYAIVKSIFENKQLQVDAFPSIADVDFAAVTMEHSVVPLHVGAVRYFREIGVEIPEELIPPEAK